MFKEYQKHTQEYGLVTEVHSPIAVAVGLPNARLKEEIVSGGGYRGMVIALDHDQLTLLALNSVPLKTGEKVARSNKLLNLKVGHNLLGKAIDAIGNAFFESELNVNYEETRELEREPLGMTERARITRPFITGVHQVDFLIPLGHGQRELILGDRKTGKTSLALSAALTQAKQGSIVVYCAIGKRLNDLLNIWKFFANSKVLDRVVLIASTADDPAGLIYLSPFAALTVAEYFRDKGHDVTVVLDDLTNHAKVFRHIFLTARAFPGRESYPGDTFFLHAKLLERAGSFKVDHRQKETAITCLPIAETVEGDITSYIATNLMGMTDGHIYFDAQLFALGNRPAINTHLSVTRVGKQAVPQFNRELTEELTRTLSLYQTLASYAHFGSELSDEVKRKIKQGDAIETALKQYLPDQSPSEIVALTLGKILIGQIKESTDLPINTTKHPSELKAAYKQINSLKDFLNLCAKL